jgi:hypothetical protein
MKKALLILALSISFLGNATETDSTKVDNFKKTDEVLSKIVDKALIVAEKTGEFAVEQAPLLLQEFYAWNIAKSIIGILIGVLIIAIGYNLRKIWGKKVEKDYDKEWDEIVINGYASENVSTVITIVITLIAGLVTISINAYSLIFILVAPKLYLIEYFIK